MSQLGGIEKAWGRRDLNPDRRVSPTRGATHACSANHGSALQSVITGISKPVRHQAHDWSPEFYQAKLRPHRTRGSRKSGGERYECRAGPRPRRAAAALALDKGVAR